MLNPRTRDRSPFQRLTAVQVRMLQEYLRIRAERKARLHPLKLHQQSSQPRVAKNLPLKQRRLRIRKKRRHARPRWKLNVRHCGS